MAKKVRNTLFECAEILGVKLLFVKSAMHFERTNSCDNNNCVGRKACHSALDIEKFLCAEISTEACLGDSVIAHFESHFCCHNGVASVCDVGKRTSVNKCGCTLQRLNKVRLYCVFEKCGHCTLSL